MSNETTTLTQGELAKELSSIDPAPPPPPTVTPKVTLVLEPRTFICVWMGTDSVRHLLEMKTESAMTPATVVDIVSKLFYRVHPREAAELVALVEVPDAYVGFAAAVGGPFPAGS